MAKSNFFNAFIAVSLLLSTNLMAQGDKTTVSISGGQFFKNPISASSANTIFSSGSTKQTSKFTTHIALKAERRLGKYVSIGLNLHATSAQTDRTIDNGSFPIFNGTTTTTVTNITNQKISSKMGGMAFNLKVFFYTNEEFEAYIGTAAGLLNYNENIETVNINAANTQQSNNDLGGLLELGIGGRYFLANNLGVYAEISTVKIGIVSGGVGQVGIIYRF
jgi:hypothetical protein